MVSGPVSYTHLDTKQYLRVPRHLYASGHPLLFKELERLVGTDNIATCLLYTSRCNVKYKIEGM